MAREKWREIVGDGRFRRDSRIQAAMPPATLQHIPQRNTRFGKQVNAPRVSQGWKIGIQQRGHDRPELVARMRVILPGA